MLAGFKNKSRDKFLAHANTHLWSEAKTRDAFFASPCVVLVNKGSPYLPYKDWLANFGHSFGTSVRVNFRRYQMLHLYSNYNDQKPPYSILICSLNWIVMKRRFECVWVCVFACGCVGVCVCVWVCVCLCVREREKEWKRGGDKLIFTWERKEMVCEKYSRERTQTRDWVIERYR